jgi:segregation and condensation protein A
MPPRKRRVTLQELIDQLQIMASQLKLVEKSDKPQRTKRQSSVQTMREALELAHQENLTEVALELEQVLHRAAKERNLEEQCWNLEELIDLWIQTKQPGKNGHNHQSGHGSMISVFWALLLLSAQSKVELFQKEFYQEISIRLPN